MLYLVILASLLTLSKSTFDCTTCDRTTPDAPICCYSSLTSSVTQYTNKCDAACSQWGSNTNTIATLPSTCGDCCNPTSTTPGCPDSNQQCTDGSTPPTTSLGYCICPISGTTSGYCTSDTDCTNPSLGSTCTFIFSNNCGECMSSNTCDECDPLTVTNDCIDNNVPIGQTVTATCIIPDPSTNCKKCDFAYACDTSNGWCDLSVIPSTCIAPQECQQISGGNSQCGECITPNTCVDECDPVTITNDCIDNNVPTGHTVTAICELDTTTNCKQCSFSYACEYCDLNALLSTCTAPKICMSAIFSSTSNSCGECKDPKEC